MVAALHEEDSSVAVVVLVDDQTDSRRLAELTLKRRGHVVHAFADANDLVDRLESLQPPPELFVLDIMMPGTNGFELLRQLRAHARWSALPALMLTALSNDDHLQQAFGLGADDYLSKPYSLQELDARVRRLIARGPSRQ
jgi:DNA-binding response OmpR family regulator